MPSSPEPKNLPLSISRKTFLELIRTHPDKLNLKSMSLALGRNAAYLHQFIHRGSPRILPEELRYRLAEMLDIDERLLRPSPPPDADNEDMSLAEVGNDAYMPSLLSIGFIDHRSQDDVSTRPWLLPSDLLVHQRIDNPDSLRLAVVGDTNADQSIHSGDVVMLDISDLSPHRAGLFAIDGGDHIRVRHLETPETTPPFTYCISHNGSSKGYIIESGRIHILGRVIFHSRMIEGAG